MLNLLITLSNFLSIGIDCCLFCKLAQVKLLKKSNLIFWIIFIVVSNLLLYFGPESNWELILVISFEIGLILFYFIGIKKVDNKIRLIGSCLIFGLMDLLILILVNVLIISLPQNRNYFWDITINLTVELLTVGFLYKNSTKIQKLLHNENRSIFVGILFYLYIICCIIGAYILNDTFPSEVISLSLGLLFFQSAFLILMYVQISHIQQLLLNRTQQELAKKEKDSLLHELKQLREYTAYLDENEDKLRHFKHDYQNLLSSLISTAQAGDTQSVIDKLTEYSNSEFDQKALQKYMNVNHIHIDELKSIIIVKLSKIYHLGIKYNFGCVREIDHLPTINLSDLIRIIGIAFDNAIEASIEIHDLSVAHIEAMFYQENNEFEFEIRNRIINTININQIGQKGFTTKDKHSGLGLSTVNQIAKCYPNNLFIDYHIENSEFVFNMIVLPN